MKRLLTLAALVLAAGSAQAGLITVDYAGNDCSGVFGQGFENCEVNGSPIIAKYDFNDNGDVSSVETNSIFPTIDGFEFDGTVGSTGSWTYNQGVGDPDVRYWVAKGGPAFTLHYVVADINDAMCAGSASAACLDLALAVTGGTYATPINPNNGRNYGLSHLSFYDTGAVDVPAPGSLALLGLGLIALRLTRREAA